MVPRRAQPDTRTDRNDTRTLRGFLTAAFSRDHRQTQALGGSLDLGGLGFSGAAQDLGVYSDRGAGKR